VERIVIVDFKEKAIKQIRMWAWAAAVLPLTALAGIFFVWRFAPETFLGYALVAGETTMFLIAVIWWWWAMYTMRNLIKQWDETKEKVVEVSKDIKDIKHIVVETLTDDK
jgi:protein-S-isoprenylcysteine O-methyltransferase Ste14